MVGAVSRKGSDEMEETPSPGFRLTLPWAEEERREEEGSLPAVVAEVGVEAEEEAEEEVKRCKSNAAFSLRHQKHSLESPRQVWEKGTRPYLGSGPEP